MSALLRGSPWFVLPFITWGVVGYLWADEADRVCSHAVQLHQSGQLDAAISEYKACLALKPHETALRSNYGAALAQSGRLEEAIHVYQDALKTGDNPNLRRNLALAYYKSGDLAPAAAEFEKLHAAAPGDVKLTLLLADCRLQTGDYQEVVRLLEPLEPAPPEGAERDAKAIAYLLGAALIRSGAEERGRQVIAKALGSGDTAEARFLSATALFVKGDYPAAVRGFASAIELNPDVPSMQSYYGQALLITGDPDGAAAAFQRELSHNPNDFEANLKLGSIQQFRKQHRDALPYLKRASLLRPSSLEARNALAKLYSAMGDLEPARAEYEKLAAAAPSFREAHAELARIYDQLGRPRDASNQRAIAAQLQASGPAPNSEPGLLAPGAEAPGFSLPRFGEAGRWTLSDLNRDRPVLLIFGSYTCPKFRFDANALNALYERYGDRVRFVLVYVQEAHSGADWQSTINQRDNISLPPASTLAQKTEYALQCARKVPIKFPGVVDGLDRQVESAYQGWPSAAYLIGRDGRIAFRSRLGEQELSIGDLERALATLASH